MKISVVIAAYNEAGNVEKLANRFYKVFRKLCIDFEIIYVLRGTKEKSGYNGLMKLKSKGMKKIRIFYKPRVIGLGPSLKVGFDSAAKDSTHILTMDADLNHQPEELGKFISQIKKTGKDIIIGSRYIKGGTIEGIPMWKIILSRIMNIILSFLYGLDINDKTSGYRLYKKEAIDKIKNKTKFKNFEYLPELLIHAKKAGITMCEVPIHFKPRGSGKSKMRIFKTIIGYIKLSLESLR